MGNNSRTLSDFGFELVVAYFNLQSDQQEVLQAMKFIYTHTLKNAPNFSDAVAIRRRVADISIEKISLRYGLYQKYADDFFKSSESHQKSALIWSVICRDLDSYLCNAEDELPDGVDAKIISKACTIAGESHAIVTRENISGYHYKPESFFMAHVEAIEELRSLEESYSAQSLDQLKDSIGNITESLGDYLRTDTKIGEELYALVTIANDRIERDLRLRQATSAQILAFPFPRR